MIKAIVEFVVECVLEYFWRVALSIFVFGLIGAILSSSLNVPSLFYGGAVVGLVVGVIWQLRRRS